MKKWTKYLFSMFLVFVALIILNFCIILSVSKATNNERYYVKVGEISGGLIATENGYYAEQWMLDELEDMDAFAMLIGDDGHVLWKNNIPQEIKESYTLRDVAAFSRWYLNDYPTYTWIREDGIFVIGLAKNTVWKYGLEFGLHTIQALLAIMPYLLLIDVTILILLPYGMTKKWMSAKEKSRSEWIAGVSHDIRTPLSIVLGNAERGSVIEKQCLRIKELVNNLNTENKLDAGSGKWECTQVRVVDVIREIVCDYMNLNGDQYSYIMDVDPSIEHMTVLADEGLIKRMFENIQLNSMRHNEKGCEIKITITRHGASGAEITIRDDGTGASEKKIKELNTRLRSDYLPEHGLGLRVVKQIAKKYKYRLLFSSEEGMYFACNVILPKIAK